MPRIRSKLLIAVVLSFFMGSLNTYTNLAQETDCLTLSDGMPVFYAPMYSYGQLKEFLPKDTAIKLIGENFDFFRIEYGDGEYGWIDWNQRTNNTCGAFHRSHAWVPDSPMSQYPTICRFTSTELSVNNFAIAYFDGEFIELQGDSSRSGRSVELNKGQLSGFCEGILQLAYARENARLWTQPNVLIGEVITTLEETTQVGIISEQVMGNIQADVIGEWVQIQQGELVGWIWLDRLDMGRLFTTQQPMIATAMIGENMRLWSAPDAQVGEVIMELPSNRRIVITGDAVQGNIQLDSDLQGTWYPVQFGATVGWAYANGLTLDPEVVRPMPWHTQ